jgi:hypothetical protein
MKKIKNKYPMAFNQDSNTPVLHYSILNTPLLQYSIVFERIS